MKSEKKLDWEIQWKAYQICHEGEDEGSEVGNLPSRNPQLDLRVGTTELSPEVKRLRSMARPPMVRAEGAGKVSLTVRAGGEPQSPFAEGDILRAGPSVVGPRGGDLFLYVLEILPSKILVAAFSPFDSPASREELSTGLDIEGLRVLSLWNVRWFLPGKLVRSWRIQNADEALKTQVKAMRDCLNSGKDQPPEIAELSGDEVDSPLDPRWDYFREAGSRLGEADSGLEN